VRKITCIFSIIAAFLFLVTVVTWAHVPSIEGEAIRNFGELAEGDDFSFEHPSIVSQPVWASKAVFAYLHPGDVDVYKYTSPGYDVVYPDLPEVIAVGALPPACKQYSSFYPAVALIGPGLPPYDVPEDLDLPFEIPEDCVGCGIIARQQGEVAPGETRPVFKMPEGDISWFFPIGDGLIFWATFTPGDYYIVIWNPDGKPGDYTANIGFGEPAPYSNPPYEFSCEEQGQIDGVLPLVEGNKIWNVNCKEVEGPSPF
jgi:hypothetical protein